MPVRSSRPLLGLLLLVATSTAACRSAVWNATQRGFVPVESPAARPGTAAEPFVWVPGGELLRQTGVAPERAPVVLHDRERVYWWSPEEARLVRVSSPHARALGSMQVSPDGKQLLVLHAVAQLDRDFSRGRSQLSLLDMAGGETRAHLAVVADGSGQVFRTATFSSDGKEIHVVVRDAETKRVRLASFAADTGRLLRQTALPLEQIHISDRDRAYFFAAGDRLLGVVRRGYDAPQRLLVVDTARGRIVSDWTIASPCPRLDSRPPVACVQSLAVDGSTGLVLMATGAGMPGGEGSRTLLQAFRPGEAEPVWERFTTDRRIPAGWHGLGDGRWLRMSWDLGTRENAKRVLATGSAGGGSRVTYHVTALLAADGSPIASEDLPAEIRDLPDTAGNPARHLQRQADRLPSFRPGRLWRADGELAVDEALGVRFVADRRATWLWDAADRPRRLLLSEGRTHRFGGGWRDGEGRLEILLHDGRSVRIVRPERVEKGDPEIREFLIPEERFHLEPGGEVVAARRLSDTRAVMVTKRDGALTAHVICRDEASRYGVCGTLAAGPAGDAVAVRAEPSQVAVLSGRTLRLSALSGSGEVLEPLEVALPAGEWQVREAAGDGCWLLHSRTAVRVLDCRGEVVTRWQSPEPWHVYGAARTRTGALAVRLAAWGEMPGWVFLVPDADGRFVEARRWPASRTWLGSGAGETVDLLGDNGVLERWRFGPDGGVEKERATWLQAAGAHFLDVGGDASFALPAGRFWRERTVELLRSGFAFAGWRQPDGTLVPVTVPAPPGDTPPAGGQRRAHPSPADSPPTSPGAGNRR